MSPLERFCAIPRDDEEYAGSIWVQIVGSPERKEGTGVGLGTESCFSGLPKAKETGMFPPVWSSRTADSMIAVDATNFLMQNRLCMTKQELY